MLPVALAALVAIAIGARAVYPGLLDRRLRARRPLGPDGIVIGAGPLDLVRANAPGVLLIHGAGDTPQVLTGLARHLHEHGFAVRVPLLSGHGRGLAAFAAVRSRQWHVDVEREYAAMRALHDWVGVVGLSMGAALAISLASRRRDIPALVLLAPYAVMPPLLRSAAVTSAVWGPLYPYFPSGGSRSIHDAEAASRALGLGVFTPAALRALRDVVRDAFDSLSDVDAPTLMIQSRGDNRILASDAERVFARLGSHDKKLVWTEGAGHVITVDFGHERVYALTSAWLAAQLPAGRGARSGEGSAPRADPSREHGV